MAVLIQDRDWMRCLSVFISPHHDLPIDIQTVKAKVPFLLRDVGTLTLCRGLDWDWGIMWSYSIQRPHIPRVSNTHLGRAFGTPIPPSELRTPGKSSKIVKESSKTKGSVYLFSPSRQRHMCQTLITSNCRVLRTPLSQVVCWWNIEKNSRQWKDFQNVVSLWVKRFFRPLIRSYCWAPPSLNSSGWRGYLNSILNIA